MERQSVIISNGRLAKTTCRKCRQHTGAGQRSNRPSWRVLTFAVRSCCAIPTKSKAFPSPSSRAINIHVQCPTATIFHGPQSIVLFSMDRGTGRWQLTCAKAKVQSSTLDLFHFRTQILIPNTKHERTSDRIVTMNKGAALSWGVATANRSPVGRAGSGKTGTDMTSGQNKYSVVQSQKSSGSWDQNKKELASPRPCIFGGFRHYFKEQKRGSW